MNNTILRAAIVGCGGIATNKHLPALVKQEKLKIVAFCDIIEERAVKARAKFGKGDEYITTDYHKVLEDETIDVVYVLTPNRSHSFITVDALAINKLYQYFVQEKTWIVSVSIHSLLMFAVCSLGLTLVFSLFFAYRATKVEIVVHGISMGAATTMMTVGDDNVNKDLNIKCAVEDCGYTSCWDEFSQEITNSYGIPPFPLLYVADLVCDIKNGWCFHDASPLEAVKNTSLPIFFIHGDNDDFVPTKMVHTLYEAKTKGDKELWVAKSSEHAFSYHDNKDEYIQKTKQFVEKYME